MLGGHLYLLLFRIVSVDGTVLCSPEFSLFVGMMKRIAIDISKAIIPPSLFGIDRGIAYANRK
jgi:hypothetical protein